MRAIDKDILRTIAITLARFWFLFRTNRETFLENYIYPKDIDQPEFKFKRIRVRIDFEDKQQEN